MFFAYMYTEVHIYAHAYIYAHIRHIYMRKEGTEQARVHTLHFVLTVL